jgi:hypothetical protein
MHPVSGSISLPSRGFFSPFPHGTGSLSVGNEYLALEDGPPSSFRTFQAGLHVSRLTRFHSVYPFVYGAITRYGRTFQTVPLKHTELKGYSAFARHY